MTKRTLIIIYLTLTSFALWSQEICDANAIFTIVETMPEIVSDKKEISAHLKSVLNEANIKKGKFAAKFTINCRNEVADIEIIQNQTGHDLAEIIPVLREKIEWKSGVQRNHNIDCYVFLQFKIKRKKVVF